MSAKANNAFAGAHITNVGSFVVEYVNFQDTIALNKDLGIPRGHDNWRHAGWYWRAKGREVGPFTSSRGAYKDAKAKLAS